jgi:hypothetical protein
MRFFYELQAVKALDGHYLQFMKIILLLNLILLAGSGVVSLKNNIETSVFLDNSKLITPSENLKKLNSPLVIGTTYFIQPSTTGDNTAFYKTLLSSIPDSSKIIFKRGTYKGCIEINKSIEIDFNGSKLYADVCNGNGAVIYAHGKEKKIKMKLSSPVNRYDTVLKVAADPSGSISTGDFIVLRDDSIRFKDGLKNVNLEVHRVSSVSKSMIVLDDFVRLPKKISQDYNVTKIKMLEGVKLKNFEISGVGSNMSIDTGVLFRYCKDSILQDFSVYALPKVMVSIETSFNCTIDSFNLYNPKSVEPGYGYMLKAYRGTNGIYATNGLIDGARHAIDLENCFSGFFEHITATNNKGSTFLIAHNGWSADHTFSDCHAPTGLESVFHFSSQGKSDPYSLTAHNINIENCTGAIQSDETVKLKCGIRFDAPAVACKIDRVSFNGPGAGENGGVGLRFMPVKNCNTIVCNFFIKNFNNGTQFYSSSSKFKTTSKEQIVFRDGTVRNSNIGMSSAFVGALHYENLYIDNTKSHAIDTDTLVNKQKISSIVFKNITLKDVRGLWFNWDLANSFPPDGNIVGEISGLKKNPSEKYVITMADNDTLTLEQLVFRDWNIVLTSVANVLPGIKWLPIGIIVGQKLRIVYKGNYRFINRYNSSRNVVNGAISSFLDSSHLGVTYMWDGNRWYEM